MLFRSGAKIAAAKVKTIAAIDQGLTNIQRPPSHTILLCRQRGAGRPDAFAPANPGSGRRPFSPIVSARRRGCQPAKGKHLSPSAKGQNPPVGFPPFPARSDKKPAFQPAFLRGFAFRFCGRLPDGRALTKALQLYEVPFVNS